MQKKSAWDPESMNSSKYKLPLNSKGVAQFSDSFTVRPNSSGWKRGHVFSFIAMTDAASFVPIATESLKLFP